MQKNILTILGLLFLFSTTIHAQAQWNDPGTTVLINGSISAYNNALLEVNGNPAIAYCDPENNYVVKYRRGTDSKGTNWGSALTIDNGSFSGYYDVDMEIINGNPAVVNVSFGDYDIRYTRASDASGTFWNSTVVVATGIIANFTPQLYCDLEEVNGKPAIAYYDSDNGDLYYVQATDANGDFWGTPVLVASTGNVGQHLSLAIINGRPAISYYDATNEDLMYVRAANADGSSWGTPMTVFSNNNVGLHTSLKDINGNPAIIFSDFTNTRMIYMRATDTDGTTWGSPVLAASHYGEETEMLVVDGKPAIAYYAGFGDQDLRYLRSNDNNGTSWGTHKVLDDGSAAMGNLLSMAIIDGNPAISYQDFTNSDLKYIRASNVSGLPVELTFFKGESTEDGTLLTWQTATEEINEGFEVQRSKDGEEWEYLDFIYGHGTTLEVQDYEYMDENPLTGTSYYRLKQIDFDGAFEYSPVIQIAQDENIEENVSIYPTLVTNSLNVEGGSGKVLVYNSVGQPVTEIKTYYDKTTINMESLPNGQYYLRIITGNNTNIKTFAFMKIR